MIDAGGRVLDMVVGQPSNDPHHGFVLTSEVLLLQCGRVADPPAPVGTGPCLGGWSKAIRRGTAPLPAHGARGTAMLEWAR
jgi:hypothetical protein